MSSLSTVTDRNRQTPTSRETAAPRPTGAAAATDAPLGGATDGVGWLLAGMACLGLVVVDPVGWDRFGPLRFLVIAGVGFWAIARSLGAGGSATRNSPTGPTEPAAPTDPWFRVPVLQRSVTLAGLWPVFLCWAALCSILAVDGLHAWIGTPERRFGFVTWLLCGGLYLVARRRGAADRRRIVRGVAIGGALLGLYTALEWLGSVVGSGPWWPAVDVRFAGGRAGGPFGQPAFLGAAAVLAGPVAAGLAGERSERTGWRIVGTVGAAACLAAVLASQSRAAIVGILAAGTVYVLAGRGRARRGDVDRAAKGAPADRTADASLPTRAAVSVMVGLVVAVLAVPALRDRVTGTFGDNGGLAGRLDEWRVGLRALAEAPVVGYGPEGYRTVFTSHVDDRYVLQWGWEVITDRAHNGLLDVALTTGVPGAVLFGLLLVLAGRSAFSAMRSSEPIRIGLGVGIVAYLVQQQFLFPLSELDPLLWLFVGLLAGRSRPTGAPLRWPTTASQLRPVAAGLALGLAVVVSIGAALDVAANVLIGRATADEATADGEAADAAIPEGLRAAAADAARLRPDSVRYRFIGARAARAEGDLAGALALVRSGLERSPADPALLGEESRLLLDIARATPEGRARDAAITEARVALEALVERAPFHPEHLQRLGVARAIDGDLPAAITAMEEAARLAPDRPEPQQNLAELRRLAEDP